MALKFKIKKADYDKLSDDFKGEYIVGEDEGEYVLDVAGLPEPEDTDALKRTIERERDNVKAAKAEARELKKKVEGFPDVEKMEADHKAETAKLRTFAETTLIDGEAARLAAKISNAPALIIPHIKARLVADMSGDMPVTKIKGTDGNVSDLTIEKLGEEFVANKDFAAIIIGSKATGGGTPLKPGSKPLGGGTPPKDGEQLPDLSKMAPSSLAERITAKREAAAQQ